MKYILLSLLFTTMVSGFLVPVPTPQGRTKGAMKMMSQPNPVATVMGSTSLFAGRSVQISDSEDSTERVTNVKLNPDGTLTVIADSTNPVEVTGNWQMGEGNKIGFIIERFYSERPDSKYSFTRIYEGIYKQAGDNLRGNGKIEMEKYGTLIQCGYFSYVTTDDKEDEMFKKIRHADAVDGMVEGIDF